MKKVFLLLAVISISVATFAQKGKVTSALTFIEQGSLDKAKEALDQAMTHPKSMDWFNTYFAKGKLAQAVSIRQSRFQVLLTDPLGEAYAAYEKSIELDPKGGAKKNHNRYGIQFTCARPIHAGRSAV